MSLACLVCNWSSPRRHARRYFPSHSHPLTNVLCQAAIRAVVDAHPAYRRILNGPANKISDGFARRECDLCRDAFDEQFGFGVIYAYLRLAETQVRNIVYASELVVQQAPRSLGTLIT